MSQHADPVVHRQPVAHLVSDVERVTGIVSLGHHDNAGTLSSRQLRPDVRSQSFEVGVYLRDKYLLGASRHTHVERDEAARATHHLDEEQPLVGLRRVTNPVDRLHGRVDRRVKTDGCIGAVEVVVDRAGRPDNAHRSQLRQFLSSTEGAIAADRHQPSQFSLLKLPGRLAQASGSLHPFAARRSENRAAPVDYVSHRPGAKLHEVAIEQAGIATAYAYDFKAIRRTGSGDGANGRIHAWRIAAAGQHANPFHHTRHLHTRLSHHTRRCEHDTGLRGLVTSRKGEMHNRQSCSQCSSMPLLLGTRPSRLGSTRHAASRARASALKRLSALW